MGHFEIDYMVSWFAQMLLLVAIRFNSKSSFYIDWG
jgi:hypothetical protein